MAEIEFGKSEEDKEWEQQHYINCIYFSVVLGHYVCFQQKKNVYMIIRMIKLIKCNETINKKKKTSGNEKKNIDDNYLKNCYNCIIF